MPWPAASTRSRSSGVSTVVTRGIGRGSCSFGTTPYCAELVTTTSRAAIFHDVSSRVVAGRRFGDCLEESPGSMGKAPGNPWARRSLVVTESATESRPPRETVVRVKWWSKSPPRIPATDAARQTPPEQGQIGGEENAHSDKDAAGRLHEGGGDFAPRGMTTAEATPYRTRLTGYSLQRPGSRERSWALLLPD
jgi:hypothetical protein